MLYNEILQGEQRAATHESGHALACALDEHCTRVISISIERPTERSPRGETQIETRPSYTKNQLMAFLKFYLGSIVVEALFYNSVDQSGAVGDLYQATKIAETYVCRFEIEMNPPPSVACNLRELCHNKDPDVHKRGGELLNKIQDQMLKFFDTEWVKNLVNKVSDRVLEKKMVKGPEFYEIVREFRGK
ncbi:hypothetical protein niasHT_017422 [Heterodera trifolii]|uniref:Peptidase M41 domain-containing protein n=1 Tax=Heterodera trifolii TaxID=157864 RepID=A0ABD2LHK3_9BILA